MTNEREKQVTNTQAPAKPATEEKAPAETQAAVQEEAKKELSPLKQTAGLVAMYAKKLWGEEKAQQFAAHLSLMAQRNPQLAACTQDSILAAMMACVHLDLMPNTPEQYAFIIPYNNRKLNIVEAQFQVGYKGLIELANRTGQVLEINAELVFDGDKFNYELGLKRKLRHVPNMEVDRTEYEKVKAAYTTIHLANGNIVFDVMPRAELDKILDNVKAQTSDGPWKKWPEVMAKKTVVKRGLKLVPLSGKDKRLLMATQVDSWAEAGKLKVIDGELAEGAPENHRIASAAKTKADVDQVLANLDKNKTVEGNDPHATKEAAPEVPAEETDAAAQ